MSTKLLGETIDIHLGGDDLRFPHHECEIAQTEPLTGGKPFVRYWMHVAMVHHDGEKMSKSIGNLVMVNDLLRDWPPDAIRIYLAMHHYRKSWNHNINALLRANRIAKTFRKAMVLQGGKGDRLDPQPWYKKFSQAMAYDLNTFSALHILNEMTEVMIQFSQEGKDIRDAQAFLKEAVGIFGFSRKENIPDSEVMVGWNRHLQEFEGDKQKNGQIQEV
jgi:L-cysteine:1D-myo-inositol 2-amino-2-deoxy-alpha-D-glucopyranoside ligase